MNAKTLSCEYSDNDSSVYTMPKKKSDIRKLIEIDQKDEVQTWQYEIVENFNRDQAQLQDCLECSICYEIVIKPITCGFCGNIFCYQCLKGWTIKNSNCPTCRADIGGEIFRINVRLKSIADYVRKNWDNLRKNFEDFYQCQFEFKLNEIQEVEDLKNAVSTNLINLHMFLQKVHIMKQKISIKEAQHSESPIIKNEEIYEKAILLEATRFNQLLESKMQTIKLDQKNRETKEQIAFYQQGITYLEQVNHQKTNTPPGYLFEYSVNIAFMVLTAISIALIFKFLAYLLR